MDDHSPAQPDKHEPESKRAKDAARNRAAGPIVSESPPVDRQQPEGNPIAAPQMNDERGACAPDNSGGERRAGSDERQRGWFWHWNGIVTQFAPLIGLKGVGLLNSYTVWTDRREDSPHRGYAFPSQQSEANFYGEDRAELITINKILVALDLVEIRKEMVLKVDEQGRRWRVPHNFYRVKDRPDGLSLTAADVIRVIELAERDAAVYRYVRKVLSTRFEPIDRDNVWHRILPEVAGHPSWQRLAEKAAKQEARASARTKAGHRSRTKKQETRANPASQQRAEAESGGIMTTGQGKFDSLEETQQEGSQAGNQPTTVADVNNGSMADVDAINTGFKDVDEGANNGSTATESATVAATNNDRPGVVEPSNTTYYQSSTTTTTTNGEQIDDGEARDGKPGRRGRAQESEPATTPSNVVLDSQDHELATLSMPGEAAAVRRSPDDTGDGRARGVAAERGAAPAAGQGPLGDPSPLVVSLFEAANDRRATPLERILLSELERDAGAPAQAGGSTGADWVAAALREAVGSGSAFVAPKRIREIINRWAAEGAGPRGPELTPRIEARQPHDSYPVTSQEDVDLEHVRIAIVNVLGDMLDRNLDNSSIELAGSGSAILVSLSLGGHADEITDSHRQRLERALAGELGQPVVLRLSFQGETGSGPEDWSGESHCFTVLAADAVRGRQLWQAVLDDLAARLPASDLARLRDVTVLGQSEQGEVFLGTSTRLASRHLSGHHRDDIQRSLGRLLGSTVLITVLEQHQWRVADPSEDG